MSFEKLKYRKYGKKIRKKKYLIKTNIKKSNYNYGKLISLKLKKK